MQLKNKTATTYLALLLGIFGAHRFYLKGWGDAWGWLQAVITSVGLVGMRRVWVLGQDDQLAWALIPFFGFSLFAACLATIIFGLMSEDKWNKTYNQDGSANPFDYGLAGRTSATTVFAIVLALLLGATALMSAVAFTGQRYFEHSLKSA